MTPARPAPIFVVGCQRSGTTLLRLVLDSHPAVACGPETRFLESMTRIVGDDWPRLARYGCDKSEWLAGIAAWYGGLQDEYAQRRGKVRWADKTPRYALIMDFLDQLFPDAQFIHIIRDPRDVVLSHRKRFGYVSAVKAVRKWPVYVATARASGQRLGPQRYLEVRYEDLVADNSKELRRVFEFIDEPWDPIVLDYDQLPHDVPDKYQAFSEERRSGSGSSGAIYANRAGAHRRELGISLRVLTRVVDGPAMREWGYR
jgi:hypothetical protein